MLAVVGGGQLARMMAQAAVALGVPIRLLAEGPEVSAAQVVRDPVVGDYRDLDTLRAVAADCTAVTFDHEHVPTEHLRVLTAEGHPCRPGPGALVHAQDKAVMRARLAGLGVPGPRHRLVGSAAEVLDAAPSLGGLPLVLKTTRGGYDGKGVWVVRSTDDCAPAFETAAATGVAILAEENVDFVRELSALVARAPSGQVAAYPVVESVQLHGVCSEVTAPAPGLDPELAVEAQRIAMRVAAELDVTGILAVELFETRDGRVLVNELAMRPHNTGHWSIDGAVTSQFENHLRAVLDLPLGAPDARVPVDGDGEHPGGRERVAVGGPVRRLPARAGPRPPAAGAPVRQGGPAGPQGRARDGLRRGPGRRPRTGPARSRVVPGRPRQRERVRNMSAPVVGIVMGSDSDWPTMKAAGEALEEFGVPFEADVVSAHRMPEEMLAYGRDAAGRGLRVIVAGAGGAAHLPGMLAAVTPLPVIGVPVALRHLDGLDSLLSIVQMPAGVPVATVAVGNARNAGLLAVRILAAGDEDLRARMVDFQTALRDTAREKGRVVRGESGQRVGF